MIDIKQLRVGAHVEYNNGIYRIEGTYGDEVIFADGCDAQFVPSGCVNPIRLTAGLLEELGFDATGRDNEYEKRIGESLLRISVIHSDTWGAALRASQYYYGTMVCRYLHELESFVYLTTKTELIKED